MKVSDIAPTTLRLPPDVRDSLAREATMNNRSLSQEITWRLQCSLGPQAAALRAAEDPQRYAGAAQPMSENQRMVLAVFDTLAPDKQLALITLLRR